MLDHPVRSTSKLSKKIGFAGQVIRHVHSKKTPRSETMRSKIIFTSILCLILQLPFSLGQAQDRLVVVTDQWAPYVFQEGNAIRGVDYEIMMAVLSQMGYEVDFKLMPWKRCVRMIEEHQADAILDISMNEHREKTMYFPTEKISESVSVLFHLKGKSFTYKVLEDLRGLTVGTVLGYAYSSEFLEADFFTREPVKTEEQNWKKLLYGRIDLFLSNKNVGLYTARKMGIQDKVEFIPKVVSSGNNYLAFSKKLGHNILAKNFSEHLQSFKKTTDYAAILSEYGLISTVNRLSGHTVAANGAGKVFR
jgi:polar amino acid transport system substrate-binding protein